MPFRDAYREVGNSLASLKNADPVEALRRKTSTGNTGNLRLDVPRQAAAAIGQRLGASRDASRARIMALAGLEVPLFRDPLS